MSRERSVVVVGGGISGLVAATRVAGAGAQVTLLERSERLGGNVRTVSFAGRALDLGAEMLATAQPAAVDLCLELGLGQGLVAPVAAPAHVWLGDRLRPLPAGVLGGLAGGVGELVRSRILSPAGALRAAADLVTPSRAPEEDISVGEIIRDRLGAQVLDRLVDPLLGGIHGGRCDDLSAQALMPQVLIALAGGKGLVRGLRAAPSSPGPAFLTLRQGLGALIDALARGLRDGGVDVRPATAVTEVKPATRGVTIVTEHGMELHADACILAIPARPAARTLSRWAPIASSELAGLTHSSAAVVALAYPVDALQRLPVGTGFLTADGRRRLVRACTWSSAKWPHLGGGPGLAKAFVGRAGDPPPAVDDGELARLVHAELSLAMDLHDAPVATHVERFETAIPQYAVGHHARVARIQEALPTGVELAGAAYRGAGIPACVRSARAAAERLLDRLELPRPVPTARSHT